MNLTSLRPYVQGPILVAAVSLVVLSTATTASAAGSLRVSATTGLAPGGQTVTVSGSGYDVSKGIYVALCVDKGSGAAPSPCIGGIQESGDSSSSAWISSNPPSYGEGLAVPYGPGGTFSVELTVKASDGTLDCRNPAQAPRGCAVVTRADHTRAQERSQDVRVPVAFAAPAAVVSSPPAATVPKAAPPRSTPSAGAATSSPPAIRPATPVSPPVAREPPLPSQSAVTQLPSTQLPSTQLPWTQLPSAAERSPVDLAAEPAAASRDDAQGGSGGLVVVSVVVVVAALLGGGAAWLRRRTRPAGSL